MSDPLYRYIFQISRSATEFIELVWPSSVCSTVPKLASHSLTVLSLDANASISSSSKNAIALIESV